MDERRRLVDRLFSREAAAERPREYVDPNTGESVRTTPSRWALAEYDRRHPADAAAPAGMSAPTSEPLDDDTDRPLEQTDVAVPRLRHSIAVVAAVGAFLVGVLGTIAVTAAIDGAGSAPRPGTATSSARATGDGGALAGAPGPGATGSAADPVMDASLRALAARNIREYFSSYDASLQLPDAITVGFVPGSFHLQGPTTIRHESAAVYAAQRGDGEYCLVAVANAARVAETCGTVADIADHGMSLTKDAVDGSDGRPVTVTVTWGRDGILTTASESSVG